MVSKAAPDSDPYAALAPKESYQGLAPKDGEVEHEIRECQRHIDKLRGLQLEDEEGFNDKIAELQQIAAEEKVDPTAPVSRAMAETILFEFDAFEYNPESHRRGEIEAVLKETDDDSFMGEQGEDDPKFVSLADAERGGELELGLAPDEDETL